VLLWQITPPQWAGQLLVVHFATRKVRAMLSQARDLAMPLEFLLSDATMFQQLSTSKRYTHGIGQSYQLSVSLVDFEGRSILGIELRSKVEWEAGKRIVRKPGRS